MLSPEAATRKDKSNANSDMQHRHFATIAAIIADIRRPSDGPGSESYFRADSVARHFADGLARTNPRFDRARFLRACGV